MLLIALYYIVYCIKQSVYDTIPIPICRYIPIWLTVKNKNSGFRLLDF